MISLWTNRGKRCMMDGTVDWDATTLKILVLDNTYTPNADHSTIADIVSHEISVAGYTGGFNGAGRKSLASKTVTQDDANDRVDLDAADLTWTALATGATIGGYAVVREATNDAGSDVIAILGLSAGVPTNGGDHTAQWAANAMLRAA